MCNKLSRSIIIPSFENHIIVHRLRRFDVRGAKNSSKIEIRGDLTPGKLEERGSLEFLSRPYLRFRSLQANRPMLHSPEPSFTRLETLRLPAFRSIVASIFITQAVYTDPALAALRDSYYYSFLFHEENSK